MCTAYLYDQTLCIPLRGKRGIKVTGALRSAGFQKIPARPQIVFNRSTGLNMLV